MTGKSISFFPRTAERLARIGRPLQKFLFFSLADETIAPGQSLSVHVERGGISVAHGARSLSRLTIKGTRHYPFEAGEYPPPEVVASTVHLAINDLKAMQADVTLIVPKAWAIMKKADFPLIVKQNLANVMCYDLDRLTPLSPEQAYYDYRIVGEDRDRLQIILAAVKAEQLDPYLHALTQKGIQVKRVIVNLSALGVLSHHVHGGETTAFLDIHPSGYDGGLIDGNCLRTTFSGSFTSAAEQENAGAIAEMINPLLETFEKEGKDATVFIDSQTGPSPLLSKNIHAPVRFLSGTDLKLRFLQGKTVPLYTALGGVLESLQAKCKGLNLLDKGIHKPERTPLALTTLLLIGLVGLGLFSLAAFLQMETKKVEAVEREIAAHKKEVRQIEVLQKDMAALAKEIQTIEQFKTARPMAITLLKEMTLILPTYAWLARVHITDTAVGIEGYAASSATDLLTRLEASRYFMKVEFASPTFRDVRFNADRFALKMEIEGLVEESNAKKR
jgi:Tfp pilus assembly protein PilN